METSGQFKNFSNYIEAAIKHCGLKTYVEKKTVFLIFNCSGFCTFRRSSQFGQSLGNVDSIWWKSSRLEERHTKTSKNGATGGELEQKLCSC